MISQRRLKLVNKNNKMKSRNQNQLKKKSKKLKQLDFKVLKERKKQVVYFFGHKFPKWKDCPECEAKLSIDCGLYGWPNRCIDCQTKKDKLEEKFEGNRTFSIHHFKDVAAFGYDTKTGRPMWVDTKGNKIPDGDPSIRYDRIHDAHGWRKTGKKVAKYDDRGRPNI